MARRGAGARSAAFRCYAVWRRARGFVLIEMTAALNLAGAQLITREHGEGEMPFVFQAHSASWEDEDAPVRILFFTEEDA